MATDPASPPATPGDFGIELDDELLAAALEAVERTGSARRARGGPAADRASTAAEDDGTGSLHGEVEIDVELAADPEPTDAPAARPGDDQGAHLHRLVTELGDEAQALRAELKGQQERLRASETERRRLMGAQRRLEEQLARATAASDQAMQARRAAEEAASTLRRRVEQLDGELHQLRDRRRREQEEQRLFGHARMVEAVLPVLDNLELALGHQKSDPARVLEGVEMILQQFHQAVQQLGVSRVVAGSGVLFDPEIHEAVSEVQTEELLPGSVVEEVRPGYALHGRLLRAARVTVATSPDLGPQPVEAEAAPAAPDEKAAHEAAPHEATPDEAAPDEAAPHETAPPSQAPGPEAAPLAPPGDEASSASPASPPDTDP